MRYFRTLISIFIGCMMVSAAVAADHIQGPSEQSRQRTLSMEEGFSPVPLDEEKSCCDRCFEAAKAQGENPGGRVCCCQDDSGDVVPQACSFADKFPNEWPPGLGQDLLDECIMEHEEGHIDEGEGVCTNISDGNPSVFGRGQTHDTCEPNQYDNEVKCLQDSDCEGNADCQAMIDARIKMLDAAYDDDGGHPDAP